MPVSRAVDRRQPCVPRHRWRRRPHAFLALLLTLAGCGGGSDAPVGPAPSFGLVARPAAIDSVRQADSTSATLTIVRSGGFRGDVTLALDDTSRNLTGTFDPLIVRDTATTASLRLFASAVTPPGTYVVSVRASSQGQPTRSITVPVTVLRRPVALTIVRDGSTPLTMSQGGLPITFGVTLGRDTVQGDVRLDLATPLPTGVSATFAPSVTRSAMSTVTLTSTSAAIPGSYVATLRASADGATAGTVAVPFTITPAATVSLSLSQPTLTLLQNGSGGVLATITRAFTSANLELSATGQPPGVTISYVREIPTNGNDRYTVQVAIGGGVAVGTYPITVTVSVPGAGSASAVLSLIVNPPAVGGEVTYRFCGAASDLPIWFGYSRGARNWIRVLPTSGNAYTFSAVDMSDVVWVTRAGADDVHIHWRSGSDADLASFAASTCASPSGRTLSGTLAGFSGTDQVQVAAGPRTATTQPTGSAPGFSVASLPDGALDVLATRSRPDAAAGTSVADRLVLLRGVTPSNGGSVGTLDFGGPDAVTLTSRVLTQSGAVAGETPSLQAALHTAGGGVIGMGSRSDATSLLYTGLADAQRQGSDLLLLTARATSSSGGVTMERAVSQWRAVPSDVALTLPEVPLVPAVSIMRSNGVYVRHVFTILRQAPYLLLRTAELAQQSGATRRTVSMLVTEARGASAGTTRLLEVPDLVGAPGWDDTWYPRVVLPVTWTLGGAGWDNVRGVVAPRADGVVSRSYRVTGSLAAP